MKRGLYIHYPFCSKICNYCDFAVSTESHLKDRYFQALKNEIELDTQSDLSKEINTIYIGGGTPSLMPLNHLEELTSILKDKFKFTDDLEFSMEINPGTVSKEQFNAYKQIGLNRVSIGVQSFQKRELGIITRNHSPKSAIKAVEDANAAGFDNISLDLMFSLPYQNKKSLLENLQIAIDLPISHISTYSLIYEPRTPLFDDWKSGKIKKHGEEFDAELYLATIEFLKENDFEQYEVSNFARESKYCKHNLSAWHFGEYFAYGVSANGFLDGKRFANTKNLKLYLDSIEQSKSAKETVEIIDEKRAVEEKFFLGLRANGINLDEFGLKDNFYILLEGYIKESFILKNNNFITLTAKGYLFCDTITLKLLDEIFHF